MIHSDATTFDLGQIQLRLKDSLTFSVQHGQKSDWYLVEDESRNQFFRIGEPEYTFVSLLDGKTTLSSALATTCSLLGGNALSEEDAIALCQWLIESQLAHTSASASVDRMHATQAKSEQAKAVQRLNPISVKFEMFELDNIATQLNRFGGWLFSIPVAIVAMLTAIAAILTLSDQWEKVGQFSSFFSRDNLLWMTVTWLLLKLIHESAHMICCKKFGGKVGKGGILLLLLIPMPFVDVTSAWKFTSKYHRMLTSAAGMLAEIFIASVAALIWVSTDPGPLNYHCANIMLAASLHTLIFNANPLMRFDGYHMLADWLEIPNLGSHGQSYVISIANKIFFAKPLRKTEYAGLQGQAIKVYGFAALIWKVLLCFTLTIAAANLFYGFGLLIAVGATIFWLAIPTCKLFKYLVVGSEFDTPNRPRFAIVTSIITVVLFLAGTLIPAPSVINAPVVVDFEPLSIVRTETAGFVKEICVEDHDVVKKGDLLLVLSNKELETQIAKTNAEIGKARIRARSMQNSGEIGAWQAEVASIEALEKRLDELKSNANKLRIHAKQAGEVIANNLDTKLGSFVLPGTELLSIGDPEQKEAVALVAQQHVADLQDNLGQSVTLRIWGSSELAKATLDVVDPKTSDEVTHFAFAGIYGGPLDVFNRSEIEESNDRTEKEHLMLVRPRLNVRMKLDSEVSRQLMAGQTGLMHLRGRDTNLKNYVFDYAGRWLKDHITLTHGL